MRVVIYARFSCSKQREASIGDQLRICHEWCAREGHEVVAEYCDRAASGRSDARPEFQRMIENAGESELVVVYAMDRFSRDVYDAPIYKKRLRDKGVRVVSATESMPEGPESILLEGIYESMAAMESARIAQRTRRGMHGNALKCLHNGVRVFGYSFGEDGRYVVDEAEADMVREVFERRCAGEAPNSIARDLAARGVKTSHGKPCSHAMVSKMLKNEKYMGVYTWGEVRVEGGVPAIVDEDVWHMAQAVVSKKRRGDEEWDDFAFAGRGACECGMNLVGTSGRGGGGRKYTYYRCSHKCGCRPIRADQLEGAVAGELRRMLEGRNTALEIARQITSAITDETAENRLRMAEKAISDAQRGIDNLIRAVEDGLSYSDVADRLSELRLQKARAESDRAAWEQRAHIDPESFADFLQEGTALGDRALLDAFVWQVVVGDEFVYVVLNYDTEKGEPAFIEWRREFAENDFGSPEFTLCERVRVAMIRGHVVLELRRAA